MQTKNTSICSRCIVIIEVIFGSKQSRSPKIWHERAQKKHIHYIWNHLPTFHSSSFLFHHCILCSCSCCDYYFGFTFSCFLTTFTVFTRNVYRWLIECSYASMCGCRHLIFVHGVSKCEFVPHERTTCVCMDAGQNEKERLKNVWYRKKYAC